MKMQAPVGINALDAPHGLVGEPISRVDGPLKVSGGARYAYEMRDGAPCAYGFVVEAAIGKGRILRIDAAAAQAAPGVLLVLTHENAPPQGSGDHRHAAPQLTGPEVHHYGQPVALLVAEQFEQARAAAYLLKIDYATEPGAYDLAAAAATARTPPPAQAPTDTAVGSFASAFAAAPVAIDVTYTTPGQTHAMMEPHATLARWDGDHVTLHTANQMLTQGRAAVAKTLGIGQDKIRLVSPYVGGGFGGKLWVAADAILAALAARQLNRPVKVALTRQQMFHVTTRRSDTIQRVRIGADKDGHILAIGHDALSDNLPTESGFENSATQTRTLYAGANRETRHRLAALDLPVSSSMRAPGEASGLLALECAMDELAEKLAIDPIELRVRNEPVMDPEQHIPYSVRNLVPCLRAGAERFGWHRRDPRPGAVRDGQWLVGMGVASATRGSPLQSSKCTVRLMPDGTAAVRMAMTDIGTGSYTILTQIAAELLGIAPEHIRMLLGDSDFPDAAGSGGSFGAASAGSALFDACMSLRGMLAKAAEMDPEQARFANGAISAGNRAVLLAQLAGRDGMQAAGSIEPGDLKKKFSQQSYGAQFAEVGVDADTGEVRIRRMLGVFTAGRVLNAKTARSQAIGGMVFGVGAALEEALQLDTRIGYFVNRDLAEYHVPVHADIPEIDAIFLPELDPTTNPLKSKGIGELGICGAGAAVANAVYNACGVRVRDYPLTLDKILPGLPAQV
jgi:xanthine dehydrogenase YagR molybdenum-binding subunit